MDRLRALSWGAFMVFVAALIYGVRDLGTPILELSTSTYIYIGFIFVLRFKIMLDDHFYFGVTQMKRWQSVIGLFIGIVSWFIYIFAGYSLSSISDSYQLLLLAMAISTIWIVVTGIKSEFYREQKIWLALNAVYMGGLGFLLWSETTVVEAPIEGLQAILRNHTASIIVTLLLLLIVFIDLWLSKSIEQAES